MYTESKNAKEISEFYDYFSAKQIETGINLRHYYLFYKIVKAGLKRNHKILEIGCGIGTLTKLLYHYLSKGAVLGTDISEKNITIARKRFKYSDRIEFVRSDMLDFNREDKYDFIILADVMEHIPFEQHKDIFHIISKHMHEHSKVFINIPHPYNIEFLRTNSPDKLQVIDQALYADGITSAASINNLILTEYFEYPLFHVENDYVIMVFTLKKMQGYTVKSKIKIVVRKFIYRIIYSFLKR